MKKSAEDKRFEAIQAIIDKYYDKSTNEFSGNRNECCRDIIAMSSLGRTERWQIRVEEWYGMMNRATDDTLTWALLQGSIFAGHGAH